MRPPKTHILKVGNEMNILVFDDDQKECTEISELVKQCYGQECHVRIVNNSVDLMNRLEDGEKIDILISDVHFKNEKENGIQIMQRVLDFNENIQVIYISGMPEYVMEVYETPHVYYLRKPITYDILKRAIDRAIVKIEEIRHNMYMINNAGEIIVVHLNEVLYFESDKRKVKVVCRNAEYITYDKIANIEKIAGYGFVRCHQSYLVNMRYVRVLEKKHFILENNAQVAISQNRYSQTRDYFLAYANMLMR